jgi:hypothetical protein
MNTLALRNSKIIAVMVLAAFLAACSSGPPPAKPGTPEYTWEKAKQAYKAGDYVKALDLLVDLSKKDNPYAAQARPWSMVLSLAMVNGYWELSEKCAEGMQKAKAKDASLRRLAGSYRTRTTAAGMQFAEISRIFIDANKDKEVTLVFDLAHAGTNEPQQYAQIAEGTAIPDAELRGVERSVLQRHMLLIVAAAMDMKKDPGKVKDAYQNGELKVPGQGFLLATAQGLYSLADIFGPKKLIQPNRILTVLYEEAAEALGMVKDNKDAKELSQKVTAMQKKMAS